jgi:hypothetical protein
MNEKLMQLTEELERQCKHFLNTYTKESKTRVAQEGVEPVLRAVRNILTAKGIHPFEVNVLEIAHFPAGPGKGVNITKVDGNPTALIRIGVFEDGRLVSLITSPDLPIRVAGPPRFVTLDDLASVGLSAYDLVEHAQRLAHHIFVEKNITQKGAMA